MLHKALILAIGCLVSAMIVWTIYRVMMHIIVWLFATDEHKKPSGIMRGTEGFYTGTVQQDTAARETKKRVGALFEAQQSEMNLRAMKPHACKDPFSCTKSDCFVVTPDKIVKTSTEKKKSVEQRTKELVESDRKNESSLKKLKYGLEKKQ